MPVLLFCAIAILKCFFIAVVIDIETYQQILEELNELHYQKGYEETFKETESEIRSGNYVSINKYLIFQQEQ